MSTRASASVELALLPVLGAGEDTGAPLFGYGAAAASIWGVVAG